jgi:hypothetical protein
VTDEPRNRESLDEYEWMSAWSLAQRAFRGDVDGAKRDAALFRGVFFEHSALSMIAEAQFNLGDVAGALETVREISHPDVDQSGLSLKFAHHYIKQEKFAEAHRFLAKITNPHLRFDYLYLLHHTFLKIGWEEDADEVRQKAIDTIQGMECRATRDRCISNLAMSLSYFGRKKDALELAEKIENPVERDIRQELIHPDPMRWPDFISDEDEEDYDDDDEVRQA